MAYVRFIRARVPKFSDIREKIESKLGKAVKKHSLRIAADIRASFKEPKHGRIYYYQGRRIQASAPGEPPAIRSGQLYQNVYPVFSPSGLQAMINPRAKGVFYAAWLEEGTSRMAPRPYITPAFDRRREDFLTEVRTELAKLLG